MIASITHIVRKKTLNIKALLLICTIDVAFQWFWFVKQMSTKLSLGSVENELCIFTPTCRDKSELCKRKKKGIKNSAWLCSPFRWSFQLCVCVFFFKYILFRFHFNYWLMIIQRRRQAEAYCRLPLEIWLFEST